MSDMQFLPTLKQFLLKNGSIYTVRRWRYRTTEVYVDGVGRCNRVLIRNVSNKEELSDYVARSGFESVAGWWAVIRRFIPVGKDMWLFKVVVRR